MAKDTFETHDELDVPASARDGLGNALIVLTAIVLLAAIVLVQKAMGDKFNAGMFASPTAAK
jgi:hypothetical protein